MFQILYKKSTNNLEEYAINIPIVELCNHIAASSFLIFLSLDEYVRFLNIYCFSIRKRNKILFLIAYNIN